MTSHARNRAASRGVTTEKSVDIALSVIVPVFDQANMIAENVQTIRERVAAGMDGALRDDRRLRRLGRRDRRAHDRDASSPNVRVLYYDRNLGKGYAVKTGAREARGRWVGYIDADLDLDPAVASRLRGDRRARGARFRDRVEAPSGLEGDLSALAGRRVMAVPAVRAASSSASTSATPRSGSRSSAGRSRRR